jgi:AraC-type DNA-binding domain-containing proteins
MKTVLVNYAQQQLNQPYRSVKMIAYELGFSDSSNFSTYFKRTVGVSPKFYRKQVIQQEMSDLQMKMSE